MKKRKSKLRKRKPVKSKMWVEINFSVDQSSFRGPGVFETGYGESEDARRFRYTRAPRTISIEFRPLSDDEVKVMNKVLNGLQKVLEKHLDFGSHELVGPIKKRKKK